MTIYCSKRILYKTNVNEFVMSFSSNFGNPILLDALKNLPERIQHILITRNLRSVEKVLKTSNIDFIQFGLNEHEIDLLKSAVSAKVACASYMTVREYSSILQTKWQHITFGCRALDQVTRNGLPIRGITEIVGESGGGKTQICLQLTLSVQLPLADGGLEKSAVYICTEDAFPSKRLLQMANFYQRQHGNDDWLDNIFIEYCYDSEKLISCISNQLPILMKKHSIGLIVIDSIAGVFRLDTAAITRAEKMRKVALTLQTLADQYECAVVCTNQVTASMNANMKDKCLPSLGLAWSNLVTTQIKIRKLNKPITAINAVQSTNTSVKVRTFEIAFSPELPNKVAEFIITANGICNVPD